MCVKVKGESIYVGFINVDGVFKVCVEKVVVDNMILCII